MMNLKESIYIPASPISLLPFTSKASTDIEHQQQYLSRLKDSLSWIKSSMETNAQELAEKYIKKQQCERLLEEKDLMITSLQAQNYQLTVAAQQYQRYLKRYEMKHQVLNNKVYQLNKTIAEKDAIIKYLEGKTINTTPTVPQGSTTRLLNDSIHQNSNNFSNLSFAKLKSTPSLMKFEDYANCSLQLPCLPCDPTKRVRADRVRTQSSDVKENDPVQNIKPAAGMSKLSGFFNTNMFGSLQNQRTLTKAHSSNQNASFWQHSKPKQAQNRQYRRHSNFSATMTSNNIYRE